MTTVPGSEGKRSRTITYESLVNKADPERRRFLRKEPEYEFTRRTFTVDRSKRGAYAPEE